MLLSSLHSSSPFSLTCSTPSHSSYYSAQSHQPMNSSPLASPSYSSPTHEAQERRRAQYKSTTPASYRSPVTLSSAKLLFRTGSQTSEDPQKLFLRERFQARCREHAQKLRERAVNSRRSSDKYSDVFMDCDDEEESDDVIMRDELFQRIVQSANHKKNHSYRVSYAIEVGSSFDPDMEDAGAWESELQEQKSSSTEPTPDDLEEEELLEYVEQYTTLADFADLDLAVSDLAPPFDPDMDANAWESELQVQERKSSSTEPTPGDLEEEELLEYADFADLDHGIDYSAALSDIDDMPPEVPRQTPRETCQISDMDVS